MIAGLSGRVAGKSFDSLLIDVQGVIYRVGTSTSTLTGIETDSPMVTVHTHLVVREDQLALFGFLTVEELKLFETLITVTGIGPRLGCAILSRFPVDKLHNAIQSGDADLLATVPGVGKKTAARLIVDLRGKLPTVFAGGESQGGGSDDAIEALRSLGYSAIEAADALAGISTPADATVEDRVVAALQFLSAT
ncbi:Holliday junction branch migration protein RuvA [soil metagenome]